MLQQKIITHRQKHIFKVSPPDLAALGIEFIFASPKVKPLFIKN